jgi:diphthamide biosynthesis methyltransferase
MLYVIGLGLSDEKDITVRGLEVSDPACPCLRYTTSPACPSLI